MRGRIRSAIGPARSDSRSRCSYRILFGLLAVAIVVDARIAEARSQSHPSERWIEDPVLVARIWVEAIEPLTYRTGDRLRACGYRVVAVPEEVLVGEADDRFDFLSEGVLGIGEHLAIFGVRPDVLPRESPEGNGEPGIEGESDSREECRQRYRGTLWTNADPSEGVLLVYPIETETRTVRFEDEFWRVYGLPLNEATTGSGNGYFTCAWPAVRRHLRRKYGSALASPVLEWIAPTTPLPCDFPDPVKQYENR